MSLAPEKKDNDWQVYTRIVAHNDGIMDITAYPPAWSFALPSEQPSAPLLVAHARPLCVGECPILRTSTCLVDDGAYGVFVTSGLCHRFVRPHAVALELPRVPPFCGLHGAPRMRSAQRRGEGESETAMHKSSHDVLWCAFSACSQQTCRAPDAPFPVHCLRRWDMSHCARPVASASYHPYRRCALPNTDDAAGIGRFPGIPALLCEPTASLTPASRRHHPSYWGLQQHPGSQPARCLRYHGAACGGRYSNESRGTTIAHWREPPRQQRGRT